MLPARLRLVDGEVLERNTGTLPHSRAMVGIVVWLAQRFRGRLEGLVALRVQVGPERYRIVDVCVAKTATLTDPYICVEVLSPEDTLEALRERLDDYSAMGVPNIWVIDPVERRAYRVTREGYLEALDGILRTQDGEVAMPLADLFL